jgi:hypothetical protein
MLAGIEFHHNKFQEKSHEGVSLEETNNFVREEINKLAKEVMKK